MTFEKRGFFTFLTQLFLSNKTNLFFSIASNQFETNLTFWDKFEVQFSYKSQLKVHVLDNGLEKEY